MPTPYHLVQRSTHASLKVVETMDVLEKALKEEPFVIALFNAK